MASRTHGHPRGSPGWLQHHADDESFADFLAQFTDDLVPDLNCGGNGRFYVFARDAFWETCPAAASTH